MRIILNDKLLNNSDELLDDPAVVEARTLWGDGAFPEKSAIDLRIFQTALGSISLLYGPRQIGKTASLKLFVAGVKDCETLCYLDCSTYLERRDLYQSLARHIRGKTTVVLDEVQAVSDWHLALRALYSEGKLGRCRVWCTGSEARHLLESGERLPGRKGAGRVVFARPWSFRKYVSIAHPSAFESLHGINFRHVNQRWLDELEIDLSPFWQTYLMCGGFPKCVAELMTKGHIEELTFDTYTDWILGTWSALRTPERSLRQLARRLCATMNSRISYQALTKGTDISSPNTVRSLLELQEDHFAIRVCPRYDLNTRSFLPAKQKKIYPIDPFIANVWSLIGDNIRRLRMQHLCRQSLDECGFFAQTLRLESAPEIGYLYAPKTKGEIDFYFDGYCFELKSKGKPSRAQQAMLRSSPESFLLTDRTIPIMAFLIGED